MRLAPPPGFTDQNPFFNIRDNAFDIRGFNCVVLIQFYYANRKLKNVLRSG
jgi:hypothetical protein